VDELIEEIEALASIRGIKLRIQSSKTSDPTRFWEFEENVRIFLTTHDPDERRKANRFIKKWLDIVDTTPKEELDRIMGRSEEELDD